MIPDPIKHAVLREAIDRADTLAVSQAKVIEMQDELISGLKARVRQLESELSELKTYTQESWRAEP